MTRHNAYRAHTDGTPYRYPFASFPNADAARRWLANDPGRIRWTAFVPPLPEPFTWDAIDDDGRGYDSDTLGACGCRDYHSADCPIRTGGRDMSAEDHYARMSRPDYDDYYDAP